MARLQILALCSALIAACAAIHDDNTIFGKPISEINRMSLEQAARAVANKTLMTYDPGTTICIPASYGGVNCSTTPGHGTQIEYFASDGRAFLWYPGNSRPVRSRWKLSGSDDRYDLCFLYPGRSYNPLTREYGGRWDCRNLGRYAARIKEIRAEDIFGLSSGRLPFPLSAASTSFDALLERINRATIR